MAGLTEMSNREGIRLRQACGVTSCESTRMKSRKFVRGTIPSAVTSHPDGVGYKIGRSKITELFEDRSHEIELTEATITNRTFVFSVSLASTEKLTYWYGP